MSAEPEPTLGAVPGNPDRLHPLQEPFVLRPENTPPHLHHLFQTYEFRRLTVEEGDASVELTKNAWPGLVETFGTDTLQHDLRARDMVNAPMCGVFEKATGRLIGYTRMEWGFDNTGKPEILSHMTAVHSDIRDGGLGEAMKWQLRQVALEFPQIPVEQLTVTWDPLQGRNTHVNLNRIGMICGHAGGRFKPDAYSDTLQGEQHRGNPSDRYKARWLLNSEWVLAHLQERVRAITVEDARNVPLAISYHIEEGTHLALPSEIHPDFHGQPHVVIPVPDDWDALLKRDQKEGYQRANQWRKFFRETIERYHGHGFTTIAQVTDKGAHVNLHVLRRNFDPFNPSSVLLK